MVSGPRADSGTYALPFRVRKTIQSIKEIVGNHSDADIYSMLKESNMDPNETAQKLLNQDPFHEVKRKKDKKKENQGNNISSETRIQYEHTEPMTKPQAMWDRNGRRGVYSRNASRGMSREFRIVKDNRVNQNVDEGVKPASLEHAISNQVQVVPDASEKSSSANVSNQKRSETRSRELQLFSQGFSGARDSVSCRTIDTDLIVPHRQGLVGEKKAIVPRSGVRILGQRSNNSSPSSTLAASNSVVGVYSKSTDPVHVPSPDSRSSGSIGAIRREVGVVGVRPQFTTSASQSTVQNSTFCVPAMRNDSAGPPEPFGQTSKAPMKCDQLNQAAATQTPIVSMASNRSFLGNHQSGRLQQTVGHQKALQPNMEWKPKSNQKLNVPSPGVIGISAISVSSPADNSSTMRMEATDLPEKLSQVNLSTNQHVIIPQHLQVPEADRSRLTFGSFGVEVDSSNGFSIGLQAFSNTEELKDEPAVSISNPIASSDVASGGNGVELLEDRIRTSRSESPASDSILEANQLEKNDSSGPQNLNDYSNIGLVRNQSPTCGPVEMQQQQDPGTLSNFSGYDSQIGYDVPFFKPAMDENIQQGLASPQEALGSHIINSGPPSSANLVQQQQSITQLYPQVHISHFPNFIPYRQMFPPVYVPPMAVPSFSSNPAYPHPSSGSSYLVMQGGSSHLTTGNLKYAPSQYKGAPAGGPVGYGNFTNAAGYAISTPGTVGCPTGLEDVSRIKYKDGNIYVPNPQAETSEIWIQTPRELSSVQSPYYNMSGQAPHAAYVPSHAGPNSFNTPTVQSAHMPFPGLYHPPQPATMSNPHPLVHQQLPGMGGNVPGAQVGAYQQPQLGHINWTPNF